MINLKYPVGLFEAAAYCNQPGLNDQQQVKWRVCVNEGHLDIIQEDESRLELDHKDSCKGPRNMVS